MTYDLEDGGLDMADQPKMPHTGHEHHMCYLVNIGFHKERPEEYQKLVKEPRYYCLTCGRVAHDEANLCAPRKIEA
jgi:hypothetical protein